MKRPSLSVVTIMFCPITPTLTPVSGSCFVFLTVPFTSVLSCENTAEDRNTIKQIRKIFFIQFILFLVKKTPIALLQFISDDQKFTNTKSTGSPISFVKL
ncbi:hypothetical protein D3C85_1111290 [compost metagenome]